MAAVQDGKADAKTYSGWVRFAAFCQVCHGVGGVGSAIAPDLAEAVKHLNHKQFETIVSCGLKGNLGTGVMPAWGSNPNIKPYLDDLWAYLRARADGALGPGRPQKYLVLQLNLEPRSGCTEGFQLLSLRSGREAESSTARTRDYPCRVCYRRGRCADIIIRAVADQIDARAFNRNFPIRLRGLSSTPSGVRSVTLERLKRQPHR